MLSRKQIVKETLEDGNEKQERLATDTTTHMKKTTDKWINHKAWILNIKHTDNWTSRSCPPFK